MYFQDNLETARTAFDGFLPLYPYCFAYWKKLSEMELKHKETKRYFCLPLVSFLYWLKGSCLRLHLTQADCSCRSGSDSRIHLKATLFDVLQPSTLFQETLPTHVSLSTFRYSLMRGFQAFSVQPFHSDAFQSDTEACNK